MIFHLTYLVNYADGIEREHAVLGTVDVSAIDNILEAYLSDPNVTSILFTVVKAAPQPTSAPVPHCTITEK